MLRKSCKKTRGFEIGFHVVAKFPGMHEQITQRFLSNVPLGRMTPPDNPKLVDDFTFCFQVMRSKKSRNYRIELSVK